MIPIIRADVLKLRRRGGLMTATGVLTVAVVAAYYAALAILHAADPVAHAAPGGAAGFRDAMGVLAMSAAVAGVLVGATAGGADAETGVSRDLAASGRSRAALFFARIPAAWALVVPAVLAACVLAAALSAGLAPGSAPASAGELAEGAASALTAGALLAAASAGLAALAGSRGMVIGIVLAFQLGLSPVLAQLEALGDARFAIPQMAIARIGGALTDDIALAGAVAVVLAWAAATLGAGLWRTRTQEP